MEVLAGIFFLAIAVTCISVIFFWFFTNNPRLVEAPGVTLNVMFLLFMTLFLITMFGGGDL